MHNMQLHMRQLLAALGHRCCCCCCCCCCSCSAFATNAHLQGDFRAKSFAITQCRSKAVIGNVKKESSHANVNAFLM
jgi:hypothetical protein